MKLQINPMQNYTTHSCLCASLAHSEKYNAVITVVTPSKYVSPQMWSQRPSTSRVKWKRRKKWCGYGGQRERDTRWWQALCLFSNLSAVRSKRAAKTENVDFLIIKVWECDRHAVVLLWLFVLLCSHTCNLLLGLCFLITAITLVWVCVCQKPT